MRADYSPRPLHKTSLVLQGLLLLGMLSVLLLASLASLDMGLIKLDAAGTFTPDWLWDYSWKVQEWIGWIYLVLFLLTAVPFLRWQYLACHNAFAIRAAISGQDHHSVLRSPYVTPGWSVGFYFVPIANLWKPYVAMREINESTANLTDVSVAKLLPLWWFLWLFDTVFDTITENVWNNAETNEEIFFANGWYAAYYLSVAVLYLTAFLIVKRITQAQRMTLDSATIRDYFASLPDTQDAAPPISEITAS